MKTLSIEDLSASRLLCELIRIPSVSTVSNRPVIEFVRSYLEPRGWHFREFPYRDAHAVEKVNLVALPPWQSPEEFSVDLLFVCHTDTVPYSAAWEEAVDPHIENGLVHGCGACDVKGFLACLLSALADIPADEFASTAALVLTAEEEIGCLGAKRLIDAGLLFPRHVIVGEPTSLHPARAGKGYGMAEIRVFGREAHSAHPALGASAIYRAARLIRQIEEFSSSLESSPVPGASELFDPPCTTLNVGTIEGGSAKNIVAAECKFLLEWRPLPGVAAATIVDAVGRMVEELRREDDGFQYEISLLRDQPGFETAADSPLIRRMVEVTGRHAVAVPFGTEASLLAAVAEDVVVFGPGDMRTAHSPRECVPVAELDLCVSYLQELLRRTVEAPVR